MIFNVCMKLFLKSEKVSQNETEENPFTKI